jgi:hypothetical protein
MLQQKIDDLLKAHLHTARALRGSLGDVRQHVVEFSGSA